MNNNLIITIGRETGSGGLNIGKMLADKLNINCYDQELLDIASKNSGICQEIFSQHDEKPTNSFLYSLVMDTYSAGYPASGYIDMPLNQKVFLAQFETIKQLAENESCIIVGRCGDYVLADFPNKVTIFITADYEDKITRLRTRYEMEAENKIRDYMIKGDKKRSSYYNYYANGKWGDAKNYDLCLNSSKLGEEGTVEVILDYIKIKKKYKKG